MKSRRVIPLLVVVAVAIAAILFFILRRRAAWPATPDTIIVAYDTTRLLGPLHPGGTVDYAAAINAQFSKGVTPDNNAAVILLKIGGSKYLKTQRIAILKAMGLDPTADEPGCWHFWNGFHGNGEETSEEADRFYATESATWSAADLPAIDAWLRSNDQAFRLAAEACARERFWFPVIPKDGSQTIILAQDPDSSVCYTLSQGLRIRAMRKIGSGDIDGALSDLQTIQRLACLLTQDTRLITVMSGIRQQLDNSKSYIYLVTNNRLDIQQLHQIRADLQKYSELPDSYEAFSRMDRYAANDEIEDFYRSEMAAGARAGFKSPADSTRAKETMRKVGMFFPDYNRMLRTATQFFDEFAQSPDTLTPAQRRARGEFLDAKTRQMEAISDERRQWIEDHPKEDEDNWYFPKAGESRDDFSDRIGYKLIDTLLPSLGATQTQVVRARNQRQAALVVTALASYHNQSGHYPDSLDALIPEQLSHLPPRAPDLPVTYQRTETGYRLSRISTRQLKDGTHYKNDDITIEAQK